MILFFHIYTNVKKHLLKRKYIVIVRQGTVHSSSGTASEGQHHHKDEGEKSEQDGEEVEEEAVEGDGHLFPRHVLDLYQLAGLGLHHGWRFLGGQGLGAVRLLVECGGGPVQC